MFLDATPPVITNCPTTMNVFTGLNSKVAVVHWELPVVTDNYDTTVTLVQTEGSPPGSEFPITPQNIYTISYGATDASGNEAYPCSFQILVSRKFLKNNNVN